MCDFPSWIEKDGKVYFLTDKEAMAYLREHPEYSMYDMVGHAALIAVKPLSYTVSINGDREGFPCPPVIARAIMRGELNALAKTNHYTSIKLDAQGRLHCLTGAAVKMDNTILIKEYWIHGIQYYSKADFIRHCKTRKSVRKK